MSVLDVTRQRTAFTSALRPPDGYTLGACLGTTYSLDFEHFTAVMLAFVGADIEEPMANPEAVVTSVAGMKSRLRVFVNAGGLHAPATLNPLFALYDRILRPVKLDGSAFHPKVWVLRFDAVARPGRPPEPPIYRVLVASRNLTDSRCWELGASFQGVRHSRVQDFGSELSSFCRKLAKTSDLPAALRNLLDELRYVRFTAPREAAEELRFDWQWPGRRGLIERLPPRMSRVLLISPFVRADFLLQLRKRTGELILVSRQLELDRLGDAVHQHLKDARIFVVTANRHEDEPALDLHAKLLAWEADGVSETAIGSANATGRGWGCSSGSRSNCEANVALRPGLGIDAIMKAFVVDGGPKAWIEQYERREDDDPDRKRKERLDAFKCLLREDLLRGDYDEDKQTLRLRAEPSGRRREFPEGMRARIVPLLQRAIVPQAEYSDVHGRGALFRDIRFEDLAAFAYVEVWDVQFARERLGFVIQFELGLTALRADARDDAVNARLLEGVDIRNLLADVLAGLPAGSTRSLSGRAGDRAWGAGSLLAHATIERVLEACTQDPRRIVEVDAVLAACREVEDMRSFREFWAVLKRTLVAADA